VGLVSQKAKQPRIHLSFLQSDYLKKDVQISPEIFRCTEYNKNTKNDETYSFVVAESARNQQST